MKTSSFLVGRWFHYVYLFNVIILVVGIHILRTIFVIKSMHYDLWLLLEIVNFQNICIIFVLAYGFVDFEDRRDAEVSWQKDRLKSWHYITSLSVLKVFFMRHKHVLLTYLLISAWKFYQSKMEMTRAVNL